MSSDWAAARLGVAIERVAEALLVVEEEAQHIVPARRACRGAAVTGILTALSVLGTLVFGAMLT